MPNKELTWGMSIDEFLSKTYGAETMIPNNEQFEAFRYHHIEENDITTLTPPINYSLDNIPIEADVAYVFKNKEGLYKAGYSWIFNENELAEAKESLTTLKDNLNLKDFILAEDFELPDLSQWNEATPPYQYKWLSLNEKDKYIEISINKVKQYFIIQLTLSKE